MFFSCVKTFENEKLLTVKISCCHPDRDFPCRPHESPDLPGLFAIFRAHRGPLRLGVELPTQHRLQSRQIWKVSSKIEIKIRLFFLMNRMKTALSWWNCWASWNRRTSTCYSMCFPGINPPKSVLPPPPPRFVKTAINKSGLLYFLSLSYLILLYFTLFWKILRGREKNE